MTTRGRAALLALCCVLAVPRTGGAAAGAVDAALIHPSTGRVHVDLGFGAGAQGDPDTRSSSFVIGAALRVLDALELTLGTKGLDHGRGTATSARSSANLELGVRWLPFGRVRLGGPATALVWSNVQLEAGAGLARSSLTPWDTTNPFAAHDVELGLGFSAGARWLPIVSSAFAAGLGAWYLGQADGGGRHDAWMAGFVVELGP